VLVCDEYLAIGSGETTQQARRRFFRIATQLPMELQMVLSNRLFDLNAEVISKDRREKAFQSWFRWDAPTHMF